MSFWKNKNVFVTGGTGFLGYWLTQELIKREANVICLVRDWTPNAPFFIDNLSSKVTVIRGDIVDQGVMRRTLNEYEIDAVFHLAAQAIVGAANNDPIGTFEANIKGTWCVLEACREYGKASRIVVASSDKAYGDHEVLPYTEDAPLQGKHPYDVSKSCADLITATYHHTYKLPVSITRCGNLFGPGDLNFSRIVPGTIKSVLENEKPLIRSDGKPMRDYVHVQDIALGYLKLAEAMDDPETHGKGFNLGTGEPKSVLDLIVLILKVMDREDLEPVILNQASGEIKHQYLSSELAKKILGWAPECSLADRLKESADWYRDYFAKLKA